MRDVNSDLRNKRFARRLQVRFWNRGETHPKAAYTTNISATGMFVSTATPLPKGSRVRVEILHADKGFMVEGVVMHAARVAPALRQLKESGMGIRFLSVEALMAELVPDLGSLLEPPPEVAPDLPQEAPEAPATPNAPQPAPVQRAPFQDDRPAPRLQGGANSGARPSTAPSPAPALDPAPTPPKRAAGPSVGSDYGKRCSIEFGSLDELRSSFERDFRSGGAFISTARPAKLHERLTVDLRLPAPLDRVLSFAARVVHVLEPVPGSKAPTGMGLEFTDPDRVVREIEAILRAE